MFRLSECNAKPFQKCKMSIKTVQNSLFGFEVLDSQQIDKERSLIFCLGVGRLKMIKFSKSIDIIGHNPVWIESRQKFDIPDPNMLITPSANNTLAINFLEHINPFLIVNVIQSLNILTNSSNRSTPYSFFI